MTAFEGLHEVMCGQRVEELEERVIGSAHEAAFASNEAFSALEVVQAELDDYHSGLQFGLSYGGREGERIEAKRDSLSMSFERLSGAAAVMLAESQPLDSKAISQQ